jgi:hypothetical protein
MTDCWSCRNCDLDESSDEEYVTCLKGHELQISMEQPEDCKTDYDPLI